MTNKVTCTRSIYLIFSENHLLCCLRIIGCCLRIIESVVMLSENHAMTNKNAKSMRCKARVGSVPCYHCPSKSNSAGGNRQHYQTTHSKILSALPLFECKRCGNFFNSEREFKDHDCPRPVGMSSKMLDKELIQAFRQKKKEV